MQEDSGAGKAGGSQVGGARGIQPVGGAVCGEINLRPDHGRDLLANGDEEHVIPGADAQAAARRS